VGVVNSCVLYRQSNCHAEVYEQSLKELWAGRALKGCGDAFKARRHIALEISDWMCVCVSQMSPNQKADILGGHALRMKVRAFPVSHMGTEFRPSDCLGFNMYNQGLTIRMTHWPFWASFYIHWSSTSIFMPCKLKHLQILLVLQYYQGDLWSSWNALNVLKTISRSNMFCSFP